MDIQLDPLQSEAFPLWVRWQVLWDGCSRTVVRETFENLVRAYSEPHRHYHTLGHIEECLEEFDMVKHLAERPRAVEAAICFHDIVYDTERHDNEEMSAKFARQELVKLFASNDFIEYTDSFIMSTSHRSAGTRSDDKLICDIDLCVFGKSAEQFDHDSENIRKEYYWVEEGLYRRERSKILRRFYERRPDHLVYSLQHFRDRYGEQAKQNLRREIERLEK